MQLFELVKKQLNLALKSKIHENVKPMYLSGEISSLTESKKSVSALIENKNPFTIHRVTISHKNLLNPVKAYLNFNDQHLINRLKPISLDLFWGNGFNQVASNNTGIKPGGLVSPITIGQYGTVELVLDRYLTNEEVVEVLWEGETIKLEGLNDA